MPQKKVLLHKSEIEDRLCELAEEVALDYAGKPLVVIAVLSGGIVIASDFMRCLWENGFEEIIFDTVKVSSYGENTVSSARPELVKDVQIDLAGEHVLVVEDIVDTGYTLDLLLRHLADKQPASLETLALLRKPDTVRRVEVPVKYIGFDVSDVWIEGYGIDTAERGRGNPNIVQVLA